jgi:hypothetical protein
VGWPSWHARSAKRLENPCVQNVFVCIVIYGHGVAINVFSTETVHVNCAEWHIIYS